MSAARKIDGARPLALLLTASDALLLGTVAAFITALSLWSRPLTDGFLLYLWAALPVIASRLPPDWPRWRRAALLLLLAAAGALGWRFVALRVPAEQAMGWEIQTALLVFWSTGFLIVQPLTYRLFDALALGVVAIGMLDGRPLAGPFAALALLFWFMTLVLRHRLFDLLAARLAGRPPIAAACGAMAMLVVASLLFVGFDGLTGRDDLIRGRPQAANAGKRRIGWGSGPLLNDLRSSERSEEPFFAVQLYDPIDDRVIEPDDPDCPITSWFWRMRVFDSFGDDLDDWRESPRPGPPGLPVGVTVRGVRIAAEVIRISTEADYFPILYGTSAARLIDSEVADARLESDARGLLRLRSGGEVLRVQGDQIELDWTGEGRLRDRPGPEHLALPDDPRLVRRLEQIIGSWSRGSREPEAARAAVISFLGTYFQYTMQADWPLRYSSPEDRMLAFLGQERRGDCNYFAVASCLILRAMGVPARIAQGFTGLDQDPILGLWTVIEGSSHVWTEYHDGRVWRPFDGTLHVAGGSGPRPVARRGVDLDEAELGAARSAAEERRDRTGLIDLLLGPDEAASRLSMLVFLGPLSLVLLVVLLRSSDRRSRPRRGERQTPAPRAENLPELEPNAKLDAGDPRSRALALYARLQRRLARQGRQRRLAETPRRHAARLAAEHDDGPARLGEFAELLDGLLYGRVMPDEREVRRFEHDLRDD